MVLIDLFFKIRKQVYFLFLIFLTTSCGVSKNTVYTPSKSTKPIVYPTNNNNVTLADKIIWTAVTYKGVPYRMGGTSKYGMDCSGLIYTSFKKRNVIIPRTSLAMSRKGRNLLLKEVRRGDLLFFKTNKRKRVINHVGLVTRAKNGRIQFIHSTSSRGVIVSYLNERYWKRAFTSAKRIL